MKYALKATVVGAIPILLVVSAFLFFGISALLLLVGVAFAFTLGDAILEHQRKYENDENDYEGYEWP